MIRKLLTLGLAAALPIIAPRSSVADDYNPIGNPAAKTEEKKTVFDVPVRFSKPFTVPTFSAKTADGTPVSYSWKPFSGPDGDTSAFLFLIDVSDFNARRPAISNMKKAVEELLKTAEPHHKVGVSVFAANLKEVAAVGTPHAALIAKMNAVEEGDLATLLWGCASEAVDALAKVDADRRALVIMSDGKGEDPVVTWNEVTKKALAQGIAVYSLGYVARAQDKKNLQGMKLVAAETGGTFTEASPGNDTAPYQIQKDFADNFYRYLENGGTLRLDTAGLHGEQTITLEVKTGDGEQFESSFTHSFPPPPIIDPPPDLPEDPPVAPPVDPPVDPSVTDPPVTDPPADPPSEPEPERGFGDILKDYWWAFALGVLAIVGIIVGLAIASGRRHTEDEFGSSDFNESPTAAEAPLTGQEKGWLETLDEPTARFPILSSAIRVGRGQDNDIRLTNDSVSKHHVEIQIDRDGLYHITDLNSGNGVYVNGNRVAESELEDGDVIELGDVRLRLSLKV